MSFTTLISELLVVGRSEGALNFLHHTRPEISCSPNVVTFNAVLLG